MPVKMWTEEGIRQIVRDELHQAKAIGVTEGDENYANEATPRIETAYLTVTGRTDGSIKGCPAGLEDGWWDDCSSDREGFRKFVAADKLRLELDRIAFYMDLTVKKNMWDDASTVVLRIKTIKDWQDKLLSLVEELK